jgi:hypothetical protein
MSLLVDRVHDRLQVLFLEFAPPFAGRTDRSDEVVGGYPSVGIQPQSQRLRLMTQQQRHQSTEIADARTFDRHESGYA